MESQVARRRVNMIAAHFAATDDLSAAATHVFPLNCSGSLNSIIQRRDNRLCFARQESSSQACFMRQVSTEQGCSAQSAVPLTCTDSRNESVEAPRFSRPASLRHNLPNVGYFQPTLHDCKSPCPQPPNFARPTREINGQKQFSSKKKINGFVGHGFEWSPRMDVAESGESYVITVELPGVSISDIRVEVNDENLTVTGDCSTRWWKVASCSRDKISAYHKREILQGPYQVVWPLPINANKDSVSAEFFTEVSFLDLFLKQLPSIGWIFEDYHSETLRIQRLLMMKAYVQL